MLGFVVCRFCHLSHAYKCTLRLSGRVAMEKIDASITAEDFGNIYAC